MELSEWHKQSMANWPRVFPKQKIPDHDLTCYSPSTPFAHRTKTCSAIMGVHWNCAVFMVLYVLVFWAYFSGLLRQPHPLRAVAQDALFLFCSAPHIPTLRDLRRTYLFRVVAGSFVKSRSTSHGLNTQNACQQSRPICESNPHDQNLVLLQARTTDRPALPLEMWQYIIDFLWPDFAALHACSLVCHAWLPVTRIHLVRTLCLRREHQYAHFEPICSTSMESLPRLEAYVQELSISLRGWQRGDPRERVLRQRLPQMHRLRSMFIIDCTWDELSAQARGCIRTACSQIRTLMVGAIHFSNIEDFLDLLSTSTNLTHLDIDTVYGGAGNRSMESAREIQRPRVELIQLSLPTLFSRDCMAILRLFQAPYGIDYRAICCVVDMSSRDQYQRFQDIIGSAGDGLEALRIELESWGTEGRVDPLILRHNTSLLYMSISTSHWLRAETTSRVQLLPLLEYAPSLPLRTLAVAFPLFLSDTSAELFIHDIDLVDDVLARTMENSPRLLLYVHMPIFDERDRPSVRRLLATSDEITGPFGAAFPRTCNAGRGRIRYSLPPKEYGFPEICDPQTHLYPIPACHAHG